MIEKVKHLLREPLVRVLLLIGFLTVAGGAGWGVYTTQVTPEQPIAFPHKTHIALGVQCLYCHPGAIRQASAGLPTQTKCWGCHQQVAKQTPELDKLKQFVESGQPIAWVPVAMVPDFVHFNHRPHIAAGLNCENCHGDMSQATVAVNPQVMNMGWCLDCHRARAGDDHELLIKLTDCATCHY